MKRLVMIIILLTLMVFFMHAEKKNQDTPLKGSWDFQLQESWSIDMVGDKPLVGAASICTGNDGAIFLLDWKLKSVYALSPEGKLLYTIGKQGEGPGEYRRPLKVYLEGRYVIVADQGKRLHFFTKKGKYFNTFRFKHTELPLAFIDIKRFIALHQQPEEQKKLEIQPLELVDLQKQTHSAIAKIIAEKPVSGSEGSGKGSISVDISIEELTPGLILGFSSKNEIFYGRNDSYLVRKIDLAGKEQLSFSVTGRKPGTVPETFKEGIVSRLSSEIPPNVKKQLKKNMPDQTTFFMRIDTDDSGLIYVYTPDLVNRNHQFIDIFGPGGAYLYRAQMSLPEGCRIVSASSLERDYVILFIEDDEGERQLVKYKIQKPTL